MNVTLTDDLATFVNQKVARGEYKDASEVVGRALRLLQEREEEAARLAELRQEIAVGIAEADQGKVGPLCATETLVRIRRQRAGESA